MSSAQIFKIGPGIEYASPMSDFSDRVGGGIGGAAQVKLDLPFITVLGAIDYISFAEKEVGMALYWLSRIALLFLRYSLLCAAELGFPDREELHDVIDESAKRKKS